MDILAQFAEAQAEVEAAPQQRVAQATTTINPADWKELVQKIVETHEGFGPNLLAVRNAGKDGLGQPVVLAALKRDGRHPKGSAHVTIYSKGTVSWTGVEPISL